MAVMDPPAPLSGRASPRLASWLFGVGLLTLAASFVLRVVSGMPTGGADITQPL